MNTSLPDEVMDFLNLKLREMMIDVMHLHAIYDDQHFYPLVACVETLKAEVGALKKGENPLTLITDLIERAQKAESLLQESQAQLIIERTKREGSEDMAKDLSAQLAEEQDSHNKTVVEWAAAKNEAERWHKEFQKETLERSKVIKQLTERTREKEHYKALALLNASEGRKAEARVKALFEELDTIKKWAQAQHDADGDVIKALEGKLESKENALKELDLKHGEMDRLEALLCDAVKVIRFCAQWGGRSGRIPSPEPGSKVDRCRKFLAGLRLSPAPEAEPKPCEGIQNGLRCSPCVETGTLCSENPAPEGKP